MLTLLVFGRDSSNLTFPFLMKFHGEENIGFNGVSL